jgi:hypothetical protein
VTEHVANVTFTVQPGFQAEGNNGEVLDVPALAVWMVLCSEHQFYVPVTMSDEDVQRIGPEILPSYLEVHRRGAQMDFEGGCGATVPELTFP